LAWRPGGIGACPPGEPAPFVIIPIAARLAPIPIGGLADPAFEAREPDAVGIAPVGAVARCGAEGGGMGVEEGEGDAL
jgi:hypothetical protein